MIDLSKITQASETEKIQMAEQAYEEYLTILYHLSNERQEVFQKNLKKLEQDQIAKIRASLQNE